MPFRRAALLTILALLGLFLSAGGGSAAPEQPRVISLQARSFAFSPGRIHVRTGETVTLSLEALDVTHGVYVDGYGVAVEATPGRPAAVTFTADRTGKFRLRCSVACGMLHPFMLGELVVTPPRLYIGAQVWGMLTLVLGVVFLYPVKKRTGGGGIALERRPLLRQILRSRLFPWVLQPVTLAGLLVAIVAGFWGTAVGSRNFALVYIWIVWWGLLVLFLLPLGGRLWCSVCPLPLPGEWLARRGLLRVREKVPRPPLRWPPALRNIWLQNAIFVGMATLSALVLTLPYLTAIALATFLLLATLAALLFPRRAFCRYLCPVGGMIGLYALLSPLQLRVRDPEVCREHREKDCLRGNNAGYGCPWGVYPGTLERNSGCGLCTECLKTCPLENVTLRLGRPGEGLLSKARWDEAFKGFILLAAAVWYTAVLLGPWGWLKDVAGRPNQPAFLLYAAAFLGAVLLVPALHGVASAAGHLLGRIRLPLHRYILQNAYALVPLGLGAWVAFTLAFVPANITYAVGALVDPLGRGWNPLGLRDLPWTPLLTPAVPYLQVGALLLGLAAVIVVAKEVAHRAGASPRRLLWASLPTALLGWAFVGLFFYLYLG